MWEYTSVHCARLHNWQSAKCQYLEMNVLTTFKFTVRHSFARSPRGDTSVSLPSCQRFRVRCPRPCPSNKKTHNIGDMLFFSGFVISAARMQFKSSSSNSHPMSQRQLFEPTDQQTHNTQARTPSAPHTRAQRAFSRCLKAPTSAMDTAQQRSRTSVFDNCHLTTWQRAETEYVTIKVCCWQLTQPATKRRLARLFAVMSMIPRSWVASTSKQQNNTRHAREYLLRMLCDARATANFEAPLRIKSDVSKCIRRPLRPWRGIIKICFAEID